MEGNGWRGIFWEWSGHEIFGAMVAIGNEQYSITARVRARVGAEKKSRDWNALDPVTAGLFRFFVLFDALEFFAGFEADGFAGGDADFFAGAGIAADAGFAGLDAEDAEAAEFDALAAAERLLQRFENSFNGLLGFGAADVRGGDDRIHDVQLDHAILQRFRGRC